MNSVGDWACDSKLVRGVARNPIYTALLILALVAVVLMATYREPIRKGGGRKAARAFVYGLLLVVGVMAVHNYSVRREASETAAQKDMRDVFTSIEASRSVGNGAAVAYGGADARAGGPSSAPGSPKKLSGPRAPSSPAGSAGPRPDNLSSGESWLDIDDVELPLVVGARPSAASYVGLADVTVGNR